jgi:hypothetical protein
VLVNGLLIPDGLLRAPDAGRWPRRTKDIRERDNRLWVSSQGVQQLAPGQDGLVLMPPPFCTIARTLEDVHARDVYTPYWALDQIVPEATIALADFEMGSDALVALDFRAGRPAGHPAGGGPADPPGAPGPRLPDLR